MLPCSFTEATAVRERPRYLSSQPPLFAPDRFAPLPSSGSAFAAGASLGRSVSKPHWSCHAPQPDRRACVSYPCSVDRPPLSPLFSGLKTSAFPVFHVGSPTPVSAICQSLYPLSHSASSSFMWDHLERFTEHRAVTALRRHVTSSARVSHY